MYYNEDNWNLLGREGILLTHQVQLAGKTEARFQLPARFSRLLYQPLPPNLCTTSLLGICQERAARYGTVFQLSLPR